MGTIIDDDPPPSVSVGSAESVPEGQTGDTSFASIHVTLWTKSGKNISVDWTTADGTAMVADDDYTSGSGTLHFAPGETDKVVAIAVIGDNTNEPDETFDVDLSSGERHGRERHGCRHHL